MSKLTKSHVEDAFSLYNTGARIAKGDGKNDPDEYVVRNPRNGDIYPVKTICVLACVAAKVPYKSYATLKKQIERWGFDVFSIGLESAPKSVTEIKVVWTHTDKWRNKF